MAKSIELPDGTIFPAPERAETAESIAPDTVRRELKNIRERIAYLESTTAALAATPADSLESVKREAAVKALRDAALELEKPNVDPESPYWTGVLHGVDKCEYTLHRIADRIEAGKDGV